MRSAPVLVILSLIGCGGSAGSSPGQGHPSPIAVSSPDLAAGAFPSEFTCDGANRRPRLQWSTPPSCTRELAVEMLDPEAPGGTFAHWLVYGILPGISSMAAAPAGPAEGVNGFGRRGYGGPCPPRGAVHHYHVVVLPLDTQVGVAAGASRSDLESRISGHVLARGELVAIYQRA
jgi:Raf kinase inhibitor-like YbhB/YbcL family protein